MVPVRRRARVLQGEPGLFDLLQIHFSLQEGQEENLSNVSNDPPRHRAKKNTTMRKRGGGRWTWRRSAGGSENCRDAAGRLRPEARRQPEPASQHERGESELPLEVLVRLRERFGESLDWLVTGKEQ